MSQTERSSAGLVDCVVGRRLGESTCPGQDRLIEEAPIAIEVNGDSRVVLMATPIDLHDLALGHARHAGWVQTAEEFDVASIQRVGAAWVVESRIKARTELPWRRSRVDSACGLCASEHLAEIERPVPMLRAPREFMPDQVFGALRALHELQRLNQACGAAHAALWSDGEILLVREDVGRHHALDKLLGALWRADIEPARGFVLISSRASYELVHKAASAGIGSLYALSAATSAAVSLARQCGLSLYGFVREGRWNDYRAVASP